MTKTVCDFCEQPVVSDYRRLPFTMPSGQAVLLSLRIETPRDDRDPLVNDVCLTCVKQALRSLVIAKG